MSDSNETEIVHRTLDTERIEPAEQVAEIIASLDNRKIEDVTTAYEQIDHVLTHIFSNPPDPDAQIEVTFTYDGYRVTVEQNGTARFVEV